MDYRIEHIKTALKICAEKVIESKELLEKIDGRTGDGDLGISMKKCGQAIIGEAENYVGKDIGDLFLHCAMATNKAAPSTMGTLICAGMLQLGKTYKGKCLLTGEEIAAIPGLMATAISARGGAGEGDRTVLDALMPLSRAMQSAIKSGDSLSNAASLGAKAAREGMERTKNMAPMVGRAKWAPENSAGYADGGAMLCWIVAQSLSDMAQNISA